MGRSFRVARSFWAPALLLAPLVLTTCGGGDDLVSNPLCGTAYTPGGGRTKDFSAESMIGAKLNAVMDTSTALVKAAKEIDTQTLDACKDMAGILEISDLTVPAEMESMPGGPTQFVCRKVKAKIDEIIATLKPEVRITIVATPAVCTVDASFQHSCIEECEKKTITETELMCTPAKLSGTCTAMCTGSCSGSCTATCKGSCSASCKGKCEGKVSAKCMGKCTGSCEGKCTGMCMGTCSSMGADGMCNGTCDGTCTGTCDATCTGSCDAAIEGTCQGSCEGSCSGSCSGSCMGQCMGSCTGGCSVMYQKPVCTEIQVMKEVTECQTTCDTQARASAMCTAPSLTVAVASNLMEERMKAEKLVAAIRKGLPTMLKIMTRTREVISASASVYGDAIVKLPSLIGEASVQTAACAGEAVAGTARALAQINVSASVSVEVHASATARAGG